MAKTEFRKNVFYREFESMQVTFATDICARSPDSGKTFFEVTYKAILFSRILSWSKKA